MGRTTVKTTVRTSAGVDGSTSAAVDTDWAIDVATAVAVVSAATAVRWAVGLGGYSGANTPPMHGDFEAQRHWMEVTYHLPPTEWYISGPSNNLTYWGLDYPPLTAYGSWACGAVAHAINPAYVPATNHPSSSPHRSFVSVRECRVHV
jgi:hypothetical protein